MAVSFETMTDRRHAPHVLRMMRELYATDAPDPNIDPAKFPATIDHLLADPSRGRILLFVRDTALVGYGVVIPYWSNEFGGHVLVVDELLVQKEFRGQGIAHAFFEFLETDRPFRGVTLLLEVSPKNTRARALYESVGFTERHLQTMTRRLAP